MLKQFVKSVGDSQHYILLTFGNTFSEKLKTQIVNLTCKISNELNLKVLILAGTIEWKDKLSLLVNGQSNIQIKRWMAYDKAYSGASLCIGHGGTSHIWYGMKYGVPLIAIPEIGDQIYGAMQIERLKIGKFLRPQKQRIMSKLTRKTQVIKSSEFEKAVKYLITDNEVKRRATFIKNEINLGGAQAGAELVHRLIRSRKPITRCLKKCCC